MSETTPIVAVSEGNGGRLTGSAEGLVEAAKTLHLKLVRLLTAVALEDRPASQNADTVETVSKPNDEQYSRASALHDEYRRWSRVVAAFLRRVDPTVADSLLEHTELLGSYFLFQRVGTNISHDVWRHLFIYETQQILTAQIRIILAHADEFSQADATLSAFVDLDVQLIRSDGRYLANFQTPLGSCQTELMLPYDARDVENFILKYCRPRAGTRRSVPVAIAPFSEFGRRLFDALVHGQARELFTSSRVHARASRAGLRIRLRHGTAPELARLPWEFLFDGTDFLCLEPRCTLVRHVDHHVAPPPLKVRYPLRVLVSISSPDDLPRLDTAAEAEQLRLALGPYIEMGLIELIFTRNGHLSALQRSMSQAERSGRPFHVWHYIGHGSFDERERTGYLDFESDRKSHSVSAFEVATLFRNHDSLRLIVMNACETATVDDVDTLSSIGGALVERGVPTVVAMQFPVSDTAAITFSGEFYGSLAAGLPVDAAVTDARRAIFFQPNYSEWATPVVYTRSTSCEVFSIVV